MQSFRRLAVWEKAHELTVWTYRVTNGVAERRFPGLSAQLCRAVASIPANLAEGAGHHTDPQFNRFLEIALASSVEADYHLLLARDLGVIESRDYARLEARLSEVRQMMTGLRKRVQERIQAKGRKGKRGDLSASPLTPDT